MAFSLEKGTGDIIINGFERGIGDSMHPGAQPLMGQYGVGGLGNIYNANLISVPGEASVNFATSSIVAANANGTMTNSSASGDTVTLSADVEPGQAIHFSVLSDVSKGLTIVNGDGSPTIYWAVGSSGVYQLYSDYARGSLVNITGDGLTGTWATINMGQPKYFTYAVGEQAYWMIDSTGYVWSNKTPTNNSPFYWTYTGNAPNSFSHGNGIGYYRASDGTGYIFAFSDSSVDYTPSGTVAWVYRWNPALGTASGTWNTSPAAVLKAATSSSNPHATLLGTDNRFYFTDANWVDAFYQTDPTVAFVPTTLTTYTFAQTTVLPFNDTAQCITQLGTNLLVGGKLNVIYPWDRFSSTPSYPILLPEYNTVQMVTVNTTTFIFVGNRGRIYYTNGSQATLYKKVPDFISNTIEPYFTWGGAMSNKNQLYFSFKATSNGGTVLSTYGGIWAVDLDTKAIRLTNTLSYQTTTYNGYATAMIPNFASNAAGTGFFSGWDNNASGYGIDTFPANVAGFGVPYTGGTTVAVAIIDSDLIPIGTFLKPTTKGRVEFKLSVPIVNGESVKLQYRQRFADSFTDISSTTVFTFAGIATGVWNGYAGVYQNVAFQNSQWIQIRAVLTSTSTSPSYVRLFELRIGN